MSCINAAIEAIESRDPGDKFTYSEVARRFGVDRSTLSRRHQQIRGSNEAKSRNQQLLHPHQELQLLEHIDELTEAGLPPTRTMIQNFASAIAGRAASQSWVTRFFHRHPDAIISRWSTGLDRNRHRADSVYKYESYFDLLSTKMAQHHIRAQDVYNMDEKGFLIGVTGRSKRVFSKQKYETGGFKKVIQDGNRDWITVIAAICADGSTLPPAIIYEATSGNMYARWVDDIAIDDPVYVTSSPSGWTNDQVGLAWLEQVFDRHTKEKAGNHTRLLILDGHGSHVTMDTHTLQPLDVVMFKPLAAAYSLSLQHYLQASHGLLAVRKDDFYRLFKPAWDSSFIKKHALKAFKATGIAPIDPEVVLKKFRKSTLTAPPPLVNVSRATITNLINQAYDPSSIAANNLSEILLRLQAAKEIAEYEKDALRAALHQRKAFHSGAVWWSPCKLREARFRQLVKEKEKEKELLDKIELKEAKENNRIYQLKIKEAARAAREEAKKVRDEAKAVKAAELDAKRRDRDAAKAIQQPQSGKRKASKPAAKQQPKKRRVGGAGGGTLAENEILQTRSIFQNGRLANIELGLSTHAIRQLYLACVTSVSDYGAQIYWQNQPYATKKLQSLHNLACRKTLGVFRTAPTVPTSLEASLLPPAIRLNSTIRNYASRANLLANTHPIAKAITRIQSTNLQRSKKPNQHRQLQTITNAIPKNNKRDTEQTIPYRFRPWDTLNYTVTVSQKSKEEEANAHQAYIKTRLDNYTTIYSDASQTQEGKGIGVGIAVYNSTQQEIYSETVNIGQYQLVYNGELEGITRAFEYAAKNATTDQEFEVYADNQAAIYRLKNLSDNPGQHWQLRCLKAANTIRRKQANIHLLWAPGHTDIVGNERADYLAKEATKEDPRSTTKSIAYLGTTIKRIQQTEQRQEYEKYKARATALNKATYSAKYPLKISKTIQMPQNTKRVTSSAFYSLKLGHGYFNSYLKRFKKRDSNRCTCQNIQTPEHLLLYCHLYKDHRKTLLQTIKHRPVTLPLLLHTSIGIEATLAFITSTRIGTRKWYLGQPTEDLQRDTV
ncbi:Trichoplein multi-domain protein [Pyrenophora tritici-repentis]|uniref:ribonuclease H n=1 Tax=Pyrenophora tritici-repentis TaxID=45151 RepID=A0A834VNF0_9PLEO|nr:Trichoplein multi-domain protein [Pyrenophora tritici-repentis]